MATKANDIRVNVKPEVENEVLQWVIGQIDTALKDRSELEKRWVKWIKQYEEILPEKKDFPWHGASNISLPLSAIAVETIHSREVNTLLSIHPYIQVRPKKKGVSKDACAQLERFLEQILVNVIDLYDTGAQWLLEKNKMGTGFLKVFWKYEKRKSGRTADRKFRFIETDDAKADVISIEDLIFPTNAKDLQSCAFVAHRFKPHWNELKSKGARGFFRKENVMFLEGKEDQSTVDPLTGTDITQVKETQVENMQRVEPSKLSEFTCYEVYFDYDLDGDGYTEPTVMTIHKEQRKILRWVHFPYNHGMRPFIRNAYQNRVKRIHGKGICEQSEHLQDAINTAFNQTIDNMTIANVKCLKGRRGAKKDIGKVYPGKIFWLDDPTDLEEFSLGEVHQSNFILHTMLRDYHERRTKVTDYTLGKESASMKSRATATGTLALLQESGRHFDLVINNSRKALSELAYHLVELYLQYRPDKIFLVDGGKEYEEITMPAIENLREEFSFSCAATSLSVNKEIEKQSNLLLLQQLGGIFSQMIQLISTVMAPQVQMPDDLKQFIYGVIRSYYTMAKDLVRSFEKIDVSSYVPDLPQIVSEAYGQGNEVSKFMTMIGGLVNGQGGGDSSSPGLGAITGMAALPGGNTGTGGEGT